MSFHVAEAESRDKQTTNQVFTHNIHERVSNIEEKETEQRTKGREPKQREEKQGGKKGHLLGHICPIVWGFQAPCVYSSIADAC